MSNTSEIDAQTTFQAQTKATSKKCFNDNVSRIISESEKRTVNDNGKFFFGF